MCEQVCEELEAAQQGTVVEKEKMKTTWARRLANRTKDLDEKVEAADARAAQAERKLADLKVCECVCVCVGVFVCVRLVSQPTTTAQDFADRVASRRRCRRNDCSQSPSGCLRR